MEHIYVAEMVLLSPGCDGCLDERHPCEGFSSPCRPRLTPSMPHSSVRRLDLGGKTLRIAESRNSDSRPHRTPNLCESRQILRKRGSLGDIFLRGRSCEELEPETSQYAQANPRGMALADKRDDRHAHPQGFTGRRSAVVRICVQCDIDLCISLHVLCGGLPAMDIHSGPADTRLFKPVQITVPDLAIIASFELEQ